MMSIESVTRALLCSLVSLVALSAHAESFTSISGVTVEGFNPPGYCSPGSSADEQDLVAFQRRNTAQVGELAHVAVLCNELAAFRKGVREGFTSWVYMLVLRPGGKTVMPAVPRREYVRAVAASYGVSPLDMDGVNRRANESLKVANASTGTTVTTKGSGLRVLEVSDDALFGTMDAQVQVNAKGGAYTATFSLTLARRLPLGLYVYGTPSAFRAGKTLEVQKSYVKGVLAANP